MLVESWLGIVPEHKNGVEDLPGKPPMFLALIVNVEEPEVVGEGAGPDAPVKASARHLIELHGGSIEARSAGEGSGATFIVRLPLPARDHGANATDAVG